MSYIKDAVDCLVYFPGVFTINALAKIKAQRADEALKNIETTRTRAEIKSYCDSEIQKIDQCLKTIEDDLIKEEREAIDKIYKDLNLSDSEVRDVENMIKEDMDQLNRQLHDFTIHSRQCISFSGSTMIFFEQQGINPLSIKIARENDFLKSGFYSVASSRMEHNGKGRLVCPKIVIYSNFEKFTVQQQQAIMDHELGHILSGHSIKDAGLRKAAGLAEQKIEPEKDVVEAYYDGGNKLQKNIHYQGLLIVVERQAEILHKNACAAEATKDFAAIGPYPGYLYLPHYCQLSDINALHKRRQKLEVLRKPVIKLKEPLTAIE